MTLLIERQELCRLAQEQRTRHGSRQSDQAANEKDIAPAHAGIECMSQYAAQAGAQCKSHRLQGDGQIASMLTGTLESQHIRGHENRTGADARQQSQHHQQIGVRAPEGQQHAQAAQRQPRQQ
ncbi:hypothetical protein D3C86_1679880 [compost metagenome]